MQPETLFYALEWYRFRWQIELVFKRFKQIAQLGHLPKYDEESAKAWLYGKLFVALLTEKLIHHACALPPGATSLKAHHSPSRWREFSFAFHQLTQAILPARSLRHMIDNWQNIATSLAEPPRERKLQEQKLFEILETS